MSSFGSVTDIDYQTLAVVTALCDLASLKPTPLHDSPASTQSTTMTSAAGTKGQVCGHMGVTFKGLLNAGLPLGRSVSPRQPWCVWEVPGFLLNGSLHQASWRFPEPNEVSYIKHALME